MEETFKKLEVTALTAIAGAENLPQLQEVEVKYLGRNGELTAILKGIKDLPVEQKRTVGQAAQQVRKSFEAALAEKRNALESAEISKKLTSEFFDITAPGTSPNGILGEDFDLGHIHPLSQVQNEVENIFSDMGFAVMDGPEVESEYYNFESLNIPADHPARDMQDTFFLHDKKDEFVREAHSHSLIGSPSGRLAEKHGRLVLRTQTSPVQVRTMQKYGAPLRIIVPGRVFRFEATDASHDSTFYQVEGLMIDKNISLAHLKGVMREFLTRLFGKEVKVRIRPGYFPFVEPGIEVDFLCLICNGKGCSVCKQSGWVEIVPGGMVHPNVLKAGGIDPQKYQGWAFGIGLTRLVMMRHAINDIRLLQSGDLRFTRQF